MDYFEFNFAGFKGKVGKPPALHLESRPVAVDYRDVQRHRRLPSVITRWEFPITTPPHCGSSIRECHLSYIAMLACLPSCRGENRLAKRPGRLRVKEESLAGASAASSSGMHVHCSTMRDLYDFRAKSAIVALGLVTILAVLRVLWGYLSAL